MISLTTIFVVSPKIHIRTPQHRGEALSNHPEAVKEKEKENRKTTTLSVDSRDCLEVDTRTHTHTQIHTHTHTHTHTNTHTKVKVTNKIHRKCIIYQKIDQNRFEASEQRSAQRKKKTTRTTK